MTDWVAQLVVVIPLLTGTGTAAKYYADNEYITVTSGIATEIRQLKREIGDLKYDVDVGTATQKQIWKLEQYRQDLDDLQLEYEANK